jgi:hypothetical protein
VCIEAPLHQYAPAWGKQYLKKKKTGCEKKKTGCEKRRGSKKINEKEKKAKKK